MAAVFLFSAEAGFTVQDDQDFPLFEAARAISVTAVRLQVAVTVTADAVNYLVIELWNQTQGHAIATWSTETGQEGGLTGVVSPPGYYPQNMTLGTTSVAIDDEVRLRVRETGDGKFLSSLTIQIDGSYT